MYQVGDFVEMKKPHACTIKATGKKANRWEITRLGADIKIKCSNCDHVVMMSRYDFERKMNKIIESNFPRGSSWWIMEFPGIYLPKIILFMK